MNNEVEAQSACSVCGDPAPIGACCGGYRCTKSDRDTRADSAGPAPSPQGVKWDQSGLKEACQRALKIGRTHQNFDIQLLLDMLMRIEQLERHCGGVASGDAISRAEALSILNLVKLTIEEGHDRTEIRKTAEAAIEGIRALPTLQPAASCGCVEKVKAMRDEWLGLAITQSGWNQHVRAADSIISALESVNRVTQVNEDRNKLCPHGRTDSRSCPHCGYLELAIATQQAEDLKHGD